MQAWRLGSYELLRRLGEGGMAQVYLAKDVRLGREVAVKVLDQRLAERPGFRERFEREARVAAALDHPNIVQLFDFGDSDRQLYLVMPYVSGGSLQDRLRQAPFSAADVAAYGSQMADALDYAHKRGVVHRDVKPANMLVHADGRLLLSDFGLAKILNAASLAAAPKRHPDAGTPEYMAPEQIEGRSDERSDIYALGVVLYLLLTAHLPFTGASSAAVMEGHLYRLPEEPRRLNRSIAPAMQAVVLRALSKHPDDRFQRAGDLGAALLSALVAGDAEPLSFPLDASDPSLSLPPIGSSGAPGGPSGPYSPVDSAAPGWEPPEIAPLWQPPQVAPALQAAPAWEAPQLIPGWEAAQRSEAVQTWQPPQLAPAWVPPQVASHGPVSGSLRDELPQLGDRFEARAAASRSYPGEGYSPAGPPASGHSIPRSPAGPLDMSSPRWTSAPTAGVGTMFHAPQQALASTGMAVGTPSLGEYPSALPYPNPRPTRSDASLERPPGQRVWLAVVIALLVALLASGVLLGWLQGQSSHSPPHSSHVSPVLRIIERATPPWTPTL